MKNDFVWQYNHTWRTYARVARDFNEDAWLRCERGVLVPARLALHILQSTKYYLQDETSMHFASGKPFDGHCWEQPSEDLPSQADILACVEAFQAKTDHWLAEMDLSAANTAFPWAGETRAGVALFLLRHNLFHLGELSALLNESKQGVVEDHYVNSL